MDLCRWCDQVARLWIVWTYDKDWLLKDEPVPACAECAQDCRDDVINRRYKPFITIDVLTDS